MSKSTMNKIYRSFFSLIFCLLLFTAIYGCGTGADTAVAPGPTPPPGGYSIALTASVSSLQAGQNSIVTATVTDGSFLPISGQTVVFSFTANPSGATLAAVGTGITDASGKAIAIYTAGATGTSTVQDMIQASAAGSTDIVTITRTIATVASLTLAADATSLAAGQQTLITATVTNDLGNPASGATVVFTLGINNSGGTLTPVNGGITDASGRATATYTAGAVNPHYNETDYVYAGCGFQFEHIEIIRTAEAAPVPTGYRMTVTATPVSLAADAISVIVANVINNATGTGASGVTVTFAKLIDNSGATLTTVGSGITDASGTAIATYTAGNNTPSLSIQDVVTASVTGSAGAVIITRLPSVGTGNRIISFTETPETNWETQRLPATSNFVIMKVTVTTDDNITPVEGETVTFSIIVGAGTITNPTGTVGSPLTVVTDDNGEAYVVFTRPGAGPNDTVVRAQIPGTTNGGDAARIVYW
jgi:5-hydroxyisourate hydrolase-like protein (transthyretin family)